MSSHPAMTSHFVGRNYVPGLGVVDPFTIQTSSLGAMANALLATALFRCWHILIFYALWATAVALISHNVYDLSIQPTLLTVIGTVLGFVISYRTTSSFERYNEGRRLWSQIILASRTFARTIWFHVPDSVDNEKDWTEDEKKARSTIEKATAINLLLAFAVGVKHYLRGEDGIAYEDLYHLVKFLPPYALPAGMPPLSRPTSRAPERESTDDADGSSSGLADGSSSGLADVNDLTLRSRAPPTRLQVQRGETLVPPPRPETPPLAPAANPPSWAPFDVFPLSLFVNWRTNKGAEVKGKKGARSRARRERASGSHNIPLEVSFYLSSYVGTLQKRKAIDAPTTTILMNTITQLVDSLTGLERILTTPIPFSYSVHLWAVTSIYCLVLPFQIWKSLNWVMIPATTIASFLFFGFLVAGEEIENPFGYDKNDLNLDHFTSVIIRTELAALTAQPPPKVSDWAFSPLNDSLFPQEEVPRASVPARPSYAGRRSTAVDVDDTADGGHDEGDGEKRRGHSRMGTWDAANAASRAVTPDEWVKRGEKEMRAALAAKRAAEFGDD